MFAIGRHYITIWHSSDGHTTGYSCQDCAMTESGPYWNDHIAENAARTNHHSVNVSVLKDGQPSIAESEQRLYAALDRLPDSDAVTVDKTDLRAVLSEHKRLKDFVAQVRSLTLTL